MHLQQDQSRGLAVRNEELSSRVDELTRKLAQGQVLTQLAATSMHDLRNVLQVALATSEALARVVTDPDDRELVQTVIDATTHGGLLTQDLLELAHDAGSAGRVVEPARLIPSIERLMRQVDPKRLRCRVRLSPHAGPIQVHPSQLEAALLNLCFNARDAMPDGGDLELRVRSLPREGPVPDRLPPGEYVEFAVIDDGEGMPPEVQQRATEAFFTTKQGSGGTGLGLSTAHAFAMRFGGALVIDSAVGRGSCVAIVLPRVDAPENSSQP
jgi:signal transduction histidine kinase